MWKNDKGVTIVALVVTILVMMILVGISLSTGFSVVDDMRIGRIVTNLNLVQAKVEIIQENYSFYNNDTDYLIGSGPYKMNASYQLENVKISQNEIDMIAEKAGVSSSDILNWEWYKWDRDSLDSQNLEKDMLGNHEFFYVNYEYAEVIYSSGTSKDKTNYYYSMTGLQNLN